MGLEGEQSDALGPFLARYAVPKSARPDLPGRYCDFREQWVADTAQGPVAVAVAVHAHAHSAEAAIAGADRLDPDRRLLDSTATDTAVGGEQTDSPIDGWLAAMATFTEQGGEQADNPAAEFLCLITVTKVEGETTDS